MRIALGIATRGRPHILAETLESLHHQALKPDSVLVAFTQPSDIGNAAEAFPEVTFLHSAAGLTRQRNTILRNLSDEEILVYLDDDFIPREDYLERIAAVFLAQATIVVATGKVVADGINGPGFTLEQAHAFLAAAPSSRGDATLKRVFNAYGCNMVLRVAPIQQHGLFFNEDLPLYGWYEDVEFSRQLAPYGEIVRVDQAVGVHLGVKSGRQSGLRLGYSQIANPVYLARRKSVPWSYAIASMVSRSGKNLVLSIHPEPYVDRYGRLQGNLRGWWELLKGQIHPSRIVDF